jgi:DNA helicase-2/ATP-dependent DNA helicase PcrA
MPSPYLETLRASVAPESWFEPDSDVNPLTAQARTALWPADPLGQPGTGRRAAVEAGAALVREAADSVQLALPTDELAAQWATDVDLLLAERATLGRGDVIAVELPAQLSVSQLVELQRDPGELARRLHRPMPTPPAPWARRGTRFHQWLESRWGEAALLDIDELPGAADADAADDDDLDALCTAFAASEWAVRTPIAVEVPFDMAEGGVVIRGRMDAVFGDADGGWTVVDWKTGRRPSGVAATTAAVQLAAYRLAWVRLNGIPDDQVDRVRAAFHYVPSGETVRPSDLLDAGGLRLLIAGSPPVETDEISQAS